MLTVTRTIKINAKDLTNILSETLNLPASMKLEFDLHTVYSDPREMSGTQKCESITLTYTEPIEELKKNEVPMMNGYGMTFVQLQYLDVNTYNNLGGLYLNPVHIVSVRSSGVLERCYIKTIDGLEYLVPYQVSDILDLLTSRNPK